MNIIDKVFKGMEYGVYIDFNSCELKISDPTWDKFLINSSLTQIDGSTNFINQDDDSVFYENMNNMGISTITHYVSLNSHTNPLGFLSQFFNKQRITPSYKNVFILISVVDSLDLERLMVENFYQKIYTENNISYYIHSFFEYLYE